MAPRETKVASKLGEVKEWVWAQSAERPGEAMGGGCPLGGVSPCAQGSWRIRSRVAGEDRTEGQGAHWEAPTWWEGLEGVTSHLHGGSGSGIQQAGLGAWEKTPCRKGLLT